MRPAGDSPEVGELISELKGRRRLLLGMLEKITVELDLTKLDEHFDDAADFTKRTIAIGITYYNVGEDRSWEESVAFKVL